MKTRYHRLSDFAGAAYACSAKQRWIVAGGLAVLGMMCGNAGAALAAYRTQVLADGATAYYEFEESSGTVAADSAGGDNNGAYLGGTTLGQTGGPTGLGRSASFDGVDDRVRIPDNAIFDLGTGAFSVELWYRANTSARGDLFTYKGTGGDFGIHSSSTSANTTSVYHNNYRIQDAPVNTAGGTWNYLVCTRAGTTISMYVNGVLSMTGTDAESMNIANDILIGSNHNGDPGSLTLMFSGNIDEVAFYPIALSAGQVATHFSLASVPEPGVAAMLGLAGVALARRRRR